MGEIIKLIRWDKLERLGFELLGPWGWFLFPRSQSLPQGQHPAKQKPILTDILSRLTINSLSTIIFKVIKPNFLSSGSLSCADGCFLWRYWSESMLCTAWPGEKKTDPLSASESAKPLRSLSGPCSLSMSFPFFTGYIPRYSNSSRPLSLLQKFYHENRNECLNEKKVILDIDLYRKIRKTI